VTDRFDRSQLKARGAGRGVHRDYLAHFLRWVMIREAVEPTDTFLDVGCGQEAPLAHVLCVPTTASHNLPARYLGVDLNKLNPDQLPGNYWAGFRSEFNFVDRWREILPAQFTKAVCFEVIEHMDTTDGGDLLAGIFALLIPGGILYLSTPVFNGKAAKAHIHEWTIAELHAAVVKAGFQVERRVGTFGNVNELRKVLSPAERECWDQMKDRLGNSGCAVLFATNHPDASRNNLWTLRKPS
jgi:2-polyprenyl-3-methyl-5-hydroxy-6-metoxy-1,4-benzoquinol methylase